MLATLLALPRSGSNRYTLRRRGEKYLPKYPRSRWRRWRFFGILLPAPFCLFPRSRTTEHRRNEFSLLLYRQSRAPRLFLFCRLHVITVSRRRDPPRITHQRQIGELDNNYGGRDCGETQLQLILRNTVWTKHKPITVHRFDQEEERGARKKNIYIYIYMYTYKLEEREGSITGSPPPLYHSKRVSTERIYPEARCLRIYRALRW